MQTQDLRTCYQRGHCFLPAAQEPIHQVVAHCLHQGPSDHGVISWGIVTANTEATSNSAKTVKWTILETDFSVVGRELGERAQAREEVPVGSLAPETLGAHLNGISWTLGYGKLGSLASVSLTSLWSDELPGRLPSMCVRVEILRAFWNEPIASLFFELLSQSLPTIRSSASLEQTRLLTPHPVGLGAPVRGRGKAPPWP